MSLSNIIRRIWRFLIGQAGSDAKIRYFKRKGMKIGKNCLLNTMSFSTEPYLVEIGNNVAIASGTIFLTHDAGIRAFREDFPDDDIFGRIIIGNNVFIGENCTILLNTIIGDNCIIGAGSVIRGKFPDNSVILGNPAQVVTRMAIQKLLYSQNPGRLKTGHLTDEQKKPFVIKHFSSKKESL